MTEKFILLFLFIIGFVFGILDCLTAPPKVRPRSPPAPEPEPKAEPEKIEPDISQDCINALIALGHKKRESKRMVEEFFESHSASNVDEFMNQFFKK
jgi:hypothetical protein